MSMSYRTDLTIIWTDILGSDHVERFPTVSSMLTRIEELEADGLTVIN